MVNVYRDFAVGFEELDHTPVGENCIQIPTGRAFLANGKPYYDEVHFRQHNEFWGTHENICSALRKTPSLHGGVYAGAAGEFNLGLIANGKASAALLFDINPFQKLFWRDFFNLVAKCPDAHSFGTRIEDFLPNFYTSLSEKFNLEAIKQLWHLDIGSPDGEYSYYYDPYSPVRSMKYSEFVKHVQTPHPEFDTGYIFCGDAEASWIANEENYRHLHHLARENAIGFLTLDVCDEDAGAQLKAHLDKKSYRPVTLASTGQCLKLHDVQEGTKIDLLYLSNICYYLQYSAAELKEYKEAGQQPKDYTRRDLRLDQYAATMRNLRGITAQDASILRFDDVSGSGVMTNFFPCFKVDPNVTIVFPSPDEPGGLI